MIANPCAIKGAGVESAPERPIPDIGRVYAAAAAVSPRRRALVLLAAFCGLRKGELFALRRRDVDMLHRIIDVHAQRQESKTGRQLLGPPKSEAGHRTLAIPAEIVPDLQAHLDQRVGTAPDALLFIGEKVDRCAPVCGSGSG